MNVIGAVMTSSPAPTPRARSENHRESVPFATPMLNFVSQNFAYSSSNFVTNFPPAKAFSSMTALMAAITSWRMGSWCALRSRNGTLLEDMEYQRMSSEFREKEGEIPAAETAAGNSEGRL